MDELALELGLVDDLPGGEIRCVGLGTVVVFGDSCELCLADDLVRPLQDLRGLAEEDRAGHVRAVTVILGTEVEKGGVPLPQSVITGHVVGFRRVCSECGDGVERVAGTSKLTHPVVHPGGDLLLGDTLGQHVGDLSRDLG